MIDKQLYGQDFCSKKELMKWIEENINKIDFDFGPVSLTRYWKEDEK